MKSNFTRLIFITLAIFFMYIIYDFSNKKENKNYTKVESCISCHSGMEGFSPAHSPSKIGCTSCHLGNPKTKLKEKAHDQMIAIPGNLSTVIQTCSQAGCHVGVDTRVKNSLMNTMSGVVAIDKVIFGESVDFDAIHNIEYLDSSAADTHLRQLCASCHIGNERTHTGPISELTRGGGCIACHLNYNENQKVAHEKYINSGKTILSNFHPSLSLNISNDHCFGCHSRSSRISTNFEGWHEVDPNKEVSLDVKTRFLDDDRLMEFVRPDIHHAQGLACIDCHNANEVMGDAIKYAHQTEAVKVECRDCHQNSKPTTVNFKNLDFESKTIIKLRNFPKDKRYVLGGKSKMPMINVFYDNDTMVLKGKLNKQEYLLSKPSEYCSQESAHRDVACATCHTTWAPQCIDCHTSFDGNQRRYDHLDKKSKQGKWIEKGDLFLAEYPPLGVVTEEELRVVKTFIQGMTMTLDKSEFSHISNDISKERRFAPTAPHTIGSKGQSCKQCHNNPVVLGYGRGDLNYNKENNSWSFQPKMEIGDDNLAKDAWIGFLDPTRKGATTRNNARAFNVEEQRKILEVGSCFTCHKEKSAVSLMMLKDYKNAKGKCEYLN